MHLDNDRKDKKRAMTLAKEWYEEVHRESSEEVTNSKNIAVVQSTKLCEKHDFDTKISLKRTELKFSSSGLVFEKLSISRPIVEFECHTSRRTHDARLDLVRIRFERVSIMKPSISSEKDTFTRAFYSIASLRLVFDGLEKMSKPSIAKECKVLHLRLKGRCSIASLRLEFSDHGKEIAKPLVDLPDLSILSKLHSLEGEPSVEELLEWLDDLDVKESLIELGFDIAFVGLEDERAVLSFMNLCSGLIVIVYQDTLKGIEESLLRLAIEWYSMCRGDSGIVNVYRTVADMVKHGLQRSGIYVLRPVSSEELARRYLIEHVVDRLTEAIAFGLRYVIIPSSLYQELDELRGKPHLVIRVFEANLEKLCILAYIASGFTLPLPLAKEFACLNRINTGFYNMLYRVANHISMMYPFKNRPSIGGEETELHRLLKLFALYHFVHVMKVDKDRIGVEDECRKQNMGTARVPDLCVDLDDKLIIVDAKTGIGTNLHDELINSIEAYSQYYLSNEIQHQPNKTQHHPSSEIWIVITPLSALLYTKTLLRILKEAEQKVLNSK